MTARSASTDVGPVADVSEFAGWYEVAFPRLVGLAALLVGSRDIAADLTQDALVKVLSRWGRFDDPDRYARRAVVNTCNSYLRRQILVRRFASPSTATTVEAHDLPATADVDDRLRAGLATLRPQERTVLVLRFWMELSEAEICETTGLKRGTVASSMHRGLRQLRETMGDV